ncbi:type IX secretion system plug protein [Arachidicoccus ginsenosidimutans]|uniref:type IX secretion system plug protein n=1 Tax=Arachidicoccus sp. BS20 TaxID=1850526 RepID=UPI0018D321BF|nr:DUF5103 domain-containing protein [Arachidicoccus sp. BS20]
MKNIFCATLFFCFLFFQEVNAQSLTDAVYNPNIHGIQFSANGSQWSYPMVNLGTQNSLQLDFDDFAASPKNYYYTFQLCDADWQPVDVSTFTYLKGFSQDKISKYTYSSYAKTKYIHYTISLPQQNCMPVKSGNYILKIFEDGDTSQLIFTRRMLIVDSKISVSAEVQQPFDNAKLNTYQKVQFSIDVSHLQISNPLQQLKVVVLQNFRWDNAITDLQPSFMRGSVYEYNGERDVIFQAGKEYRWVDLQSFRYQSERVGSVDVSKIPFDVYVKPDKSRADEDYLPYKDYNGFFNIAASEQINVQSQGDYARVHFSFVPPDGKEFANKDVYIVGQMNNYNYSDENEMTFDADKNCYETSLLLKQGYYNYMYVTKDANNAMPTFSLTEGNNWLTENNYTILVYYQSFSDRAPQLVGCTTVSSRSTNF